ncbi:MAG TPA: chorismate synthase [Thermodesulfobacteriota bacterium]|nr:chorismate synthase [Thermodesulfobacteriota bacterium]
MLRYLTAGESHGKALVAIVDGIPAGLPLTADDVNRDLARRQAGYGRGGRMKIEKDAVEFLGGVRQGVTLGSPIAMLIANRDWANWAAVMAPEPPAAIPVDDDGEPVPGDPRVTRVVTRPRPGHADLAGALKYGHRDLRNVLERASARETAGRVAVGAVAKRLLAELGIAVYSYVLEIGGVGFDPTGLDPAEAHRRAEGSELRCPDEATTARMRARIDEAKRQGDSVGGIFEVVVTGVPAGLGSHVQWDRKLDGRLARALMSVQAMKGVEVGLGFAGARVGGKAFHDEILPDPDRGARGLPPLSRPTNRAGGIEGGMSNGEPIVVRVAQKPIATLAHPLRSVDLATGEPVTAAYERSDVCAVPAGSVIGEAVVAIEIADALLEKVGGDSLEEVRAHLEATRRLQAGLVRR